LVSNKSFPFPLSHNSTFTITGTPAPSVTKTSGDSRITWNGVTWQLDIDIEYPQIHALGIMGIYGKCGTFLPAMPGLCPQCSLFARSLPAMPAFCPLI